MSLQLQAVTVAGAVLATDTLAGVDYQVVKVALGAAGAVDVHVDSGQQLMANSVPVAIASNQSALTIQDGGGTITVDGSVDTELPTAALLADNTANPTIPSVGVFPHWFDGVTWDRAPGTSADGLLVNLGANNDVTVTSGSISISGTVAVTQSTSPWVVSGTVAVSSVAGTVTCDTELPAAAALTDNFANPTAPAVGSFLMLWDGATWDRWPGTSALGATVNVSFLAGSAITLGAGAVAAGTQRVTLASDDPAVVSLGVMDDWDESDRAKVNLIVGQAGVAAGAGAVGATVQRVTLASDDPAVVSLGLLDDVVIADDAAFTPAVTKVLMLGATFDDVAPDSVNEGDAGAVRMSANRNLYATLRDAAGNERGLNIDASGQVSVTSITSSVVPGTGATNLGKAEDAVHGSGDTGVFILCVANEANTVRAADGDYIALATDTEGNVRIVGNRDHDAVDAGEVVKVGSKAIDYEPDTNDTRSGGMTAVAENDRAQFAANLYGEQIDGVNGYFFQLDNVGTTYNNTTTTATSTSKECWNYRWAGVGFTLVSANTPTDITFDVEVSYDGTNFYKVMNGPLGLWIYDDTCCSSSISRTLWFPIACRDIRVKVTATGTSASNTFTVSNARLYLRN